MKWLHTPRLVVLTVFAALACDSSAAGCGGCSDCGREYLAELTEAQVQVERDYAAKPGKWHTSHEGDQFVLGDGLRTGPQSSALLDMNPSGSVLVESSTTIRFERSGAGAARFDIESGAVEVEASGVDLEVGSPSGLTRVTSGSKVSVRTRAGGPTQISVQAGEAIIEREGESGVRTVTAGEVVDLMVGEALIEVEALSDAGADPSADAGETDAGETDAARDTHDETGDWSGTLEDGPTPEVPLTPGEAATIHSVQLPARIGVGFECDEGALVELRRRRAKRFRPVSRGRTYVTLELGKGLYFYRVRCLKDGRPARAAKHRGRIRVVADAGTRKLPAKAQRVNVDADGRHYRIQYSNRLPRLTFDWRDAPPAASYVLNVSSSKGRHSLVRESKNPRLALGEGTLGEGQHSYRWQTADGSARSKLSVLEISFENPGRTAYLANELSAGDEPGTLELSGAALTQSRVTIDNHPVPLDKQGRFSHAVEVSEGGTVAVRVAHPTTGVHYYLRRAR